MTEIHPGLYWLMVASLVFAIAYFLAHLVPFIQGRFEKRRARLNAEVTTASGGGGGGNGGSTIVDIDVPRVKIVEGEGGRGAGETRIEYVGGGGYASGSDGSRGGSGGNVEPSERE
jgi:hypothetical protein